MINEMYVFIGEGSNFPAGIFTTLDNAKEWIEKYSLSGILNKFPIDMGIYDWAVKEDLFSIKRQYQKESAFIQTFTCASMEHFHFENGKLA